MGIMDELKSFVIVVMLLPIAFGIPVEQRRADGMADEPETSISFPRRVGNATSKSTLEQYVRDLYEEYASESAGKLRYGDDKPTDIWCFPDKDVAQGYFRAKPVRHTKCATYTQYVFQWSSVAGEIGNTALSVRSSILRAYIQPISRHIKNNETVNVTLTIKMVPRNGNETTNNSDSILAGQQVISVSHGSDGWAELNVTEGATEIWPLRKNYTEVQVIIIAEVDCIEQKKVPIKLVNPAEIPLDKPLRREHYLPIQPFLVINTDNKITQTLLQQEEAMNKQRTDDNSSSDYIIDELYPATSTHSKRHTSNSCSRSNFTVNLIALGVPHIVWPLEINIFKCSGICNLATLSKLGTNHAKIMAHVHNQQQLSPQPSVTATYPCCVPTKYNTVYLLIQAEDHTATGVKSFNELIASECGCR
jgi:hypothetical protein